MESDALKRAPFVQKADCLNLVASTAAWIVWLAANWVLVVTTRMCASYLLPNGIAAITSEPLRQAVAMVFGILLVSAVGFLFFAQIHIRDAVIRAWGGEKSQAREVLNSDSPTTNGTTSVHHP